MEITLTTVAGFVVFLLAIFFMVRRMRKGASSDAASDSEHVAADAENQKKKSGCGTVMIKIAYFIIVVGIVILVLRFTT